MNLLDLGGVFDTTEMRVDQSPFPTLSFHYWAMALIL